MKLPFTGSGIGEQISVKSCSALAENLYPEVNPKESNNLVLRPTMGTGANNVADVGTEPNSGTGCRGAIEAESSIFVFGNSVYSYRVLKVDALLGTDSGRVSMSTSGGSTNRQVLIVDGADAYVYSVTYETGWKLDGTTTYNTSGTTDAGTTTNKLIDTGAGFSEGTSHELGMTVHNTDTDEWAFITATDSGDQLSISADIFDGGSEAYEIAASYNTSGASASAGNTPFTDAKTCTYMDGYFIVDDQGSDNSGRFYISETNDASRWNALDFATAERSPDNLQCVYALNRELYLIGTTTTEVWYNSGNADFPFSPIQQGFIQYGTLFPYTVESSGDSLYWVTKSKGGFSDIIKVSGISYEFVGSEEVTKDLSSLGGAAAAGGSLVDNDSHFALAFEYAGHYFYLLTHGIGPTYKKTIVYDDKTGMWHRFTSAGNEYFNAGGFALDPDSKIPRYGELDDNTVQLLIPSRSVKGVDTIRKFRTRVIHNEGSLVTYHAVQLDIDSRAAFPHVEATDAGGFRTSFYPVQEFNVSAPYSSGDYDVENITTGTSAVSVTGLAFYNVTASGTWSKGDEVKFTDSGTGDNLISSPSVSMRFRKNGGKWSTAKSRSFTSSTTRLIWRKLGKAFDMEFEFTITGGLPFSILDGYAIIEMADRDL